MHARTKADDCLVRSSFSEASLSLSWSHGFVFFRRPPLQSSLLINSFLQATGETYDATSLLFQALLVRAAADRAVLNVERARRGLPAYPPIIQVWTMSASLVFSSLEPRTDSPFVLAVFFKRDTRMMNHLTKKRGFSTLEDYMKLHPDANLAAFPPIRPVYIPEECELSLPALGRKRRKTDHRPWRSCCRSDRMAGHGAPSV